MKGHPPGGQAPELYLQNQGGGLLTELQGGCKYIMNT